MLAVDEDGDTVHCTVDCHTQDAESKTYTQATFNAAFRYNPKENSVNLFYNEATISRIGH